MHSSFPPIKDALPPPVNQAGGIWQPGEFTQRNSNYRECNRPRAPAAGSEV